jgi:hypothetical protein
MDNREFDKINELKRIMKTVDGRDFIFQFLADSCGVDLSVGIPSTQKDDFRQGMMKPAIDLFNLIVYHCYNDFLTMLSEQKLRAQQKEKDND